MDRLISSIIAILIAKQRGISSQGLEEALGDPFEEFVDYPQFWHHSFELS